MNMVVLNECRSLIHYRAFRNTDAPQLAEVWRSQTAQRGLMQPMSASVLERFVFSRPTFEAQGLIVAAEEDKVLGFAHAGFGPSEDQSTLATENGVTCLVMLRPDVDPSITGELLERSEAFLENRGAKTLYGGGSYPLAPFYQGLYGGSEFSGVLDSDRRGQAIFQEHGYRPVKRSLVLHRDLASFRPVVDRVQMQIRRQHCVEMIVDPPTATWWEACVFEPFDRIRCVLLARDRGAPPAAVNFWNMETMIGAWGVHGVGIAGLEVAGNRRRAGLATFLLGESLRNLHAQGVALAEVHVAEENAAALAVFRNLGFEQVDAAVLYRKD
jgi:ribosomal protein S18 acetylase RimI-like enzyme